MALSKTFQIVSFHVVVVAVFLVKCAAKSSNEVTTKTSFENVTWRAKLLFSLDRFANFCCSCCRCYRGLLKLPNISVLSRQISLSSCKLQYWTDWTKSNCELTLGRHVFGVFEVLAKNINYSETAESSVQLRTEKFKYSEMFQDTEIRLN